jgi:hypothetical protein
MLSLWINAVVFLIEGCFIYCTKPTGPLDFPQSAGYPHLAVYSSGGSAAVSGGHQNHRQRVLLLLHALAMARPPAAPTTAAYYTPR